MISCEDSRCILVICIMKPKKYHYIDTVVLLTAKKSGLGLSFY